MKVWLLMLAVSPAMGQDLPINVTYPPEGHPVSASSMQVLGWVTHPKAAFRVNGAQVKPYRNGAFLAYVPVQPGQFPIRCELDLPQGTTRYTRMIKVTPPREPIPPGPPRIDPESLEPSSDWELRPGDWLTLEFRGTPGLAAEFQAGREKKRWPMAESAAGLYQGAWQAPAQDSSEPVEFRYTLRSEAERTQSTAAAPKKVAVISGPRVATVRGAGAVPLKAAPDGGHIVFPPAGTRLLVTGRRGDELRVELAAGLEGWISASAAQFSQPGTPAPRALLGTMRTSYSGNSSSVHLGLSDTVPFTVDADAGLDKLVVTLYHTTGNTQWVIYHSSDPVVRQVQWRQAGTGVVTVSIELERSARLWGWRASWESGALRIELPHPPRLPASGPALKGRVIVLDPGHMPSQPGALGPRGTLEKDVNLALAKELQKLLAAAGARPVMTRAGDYEVSLHDRPRIAWDNGGEVFVSLHHNNLPDGANPFRWPHGYSIFYYHPLSLDLARAVHRAYQRRVPLSDEGVRFGNLLVARTTEMPSVLVESAYMTYPEQEALLDTPAFRRKTAGALLEGLRDFFEAERSRQAAAGFPARLSSAAGPPAAPAPGRKSRPGRPAAALPSAKEAGEPDLEPALGSPAAAAAPSAESAAEKSSLGPAAGSPSAQAPSAARPAAGPKGKAKALPRRQRRGKARAPTGARPR